MQLSGDANTVSSASNTFSGAFWVQRPWYPENFLLRWTLKGCALNLQGNTLVEPIRGVRRISTHKNGSTNLPRIHVLQQHVGVHGRPVCPIPQVVRWHDALCCHGARDSRQYGPATLLVSQSPVRGGSVHDCQGKAGLQW